MAGEESKTPRGRWHDLALGLVIIGIGLVFLLGNFGIRLPFLGLHNWWALFILIAAVPSLAKAAEAYHRAGRVDHAVLGGLLSALAPLMVAAFFLLELDWGTWWPLFVIYGGLWVLLGGKRRWKDPV